MFNKNIKNEVFSQFKEALKDPKKLANLNYKKIAFLNAYLVPSARTAPTGSLADDPTPPPPDPDNASEQATITSWFSSLQLLNGVPFSYLVPREDLLPPESIRFFYVDNNWIAALIDGAYSIGRTTKSDQAHDGLFNEHLHLSSQNQSKNTRANVFGTSTPLADSPSNIVTGLLLRSKAVSGWPGLEIDGYNTSPPTPKDEPLDLIRMDHITSDILLCLFNGEVNSVKIHNPSEGLHFGLDQPSTVPINYINTSNYTKTLRIMKNTDSTYNGVLYPNPDPNNISPLTIDTSYYRSDEKNVLNIKQLSDYIYTNVQAEINKSPSPSTLAPFTSAEFALQMTVGVDMAVLLEKVSENLNQTPQAKTTVNKTLKLSTPKNKRR